MDLPEAEYRVRATLRDLRIVALLYAIQYRALPWGTADFPGATECDGIWQMGGHVYSQLEIHTMARIGWIKTDERDGLGRPHTTAGPALQAALASITH